MMRSWKQRILIGLVAAFAVLIVTDVQAGIFRRRRWRDGYVYNAAPAYGTAGVNRAGPGGQIRGGANINTPGANVRAGTNLNAPGATVGAGANVNAPGAGADANLRVRGQSPEDRSAALPPAPGQQPAPPTPVPGTPPMP